MKRKKKSQHFNHERWLVSYADFMTLLFAFFVVLYASSQSDRSKMTQLAAAIQSAFKNLGVFHGTTMGAHVDPNSIASATALSRPALNATQSPSLASLQVELEGSLSEQIRRNSISLQSGPDGLVIRLREMAFYESGSAQLRTDSLPTLRTIARILSRNGFSVRIEGHTDDVPIHNRQFDSNWELSTARATSMVKLFTSDFSFAPERLSAAGYGEFHPVGANSTQEGRRLNRRIDIVVLRPEDHVSSAREQDSSKLVPDIAAGQ